jgi:hypothetical protein
VQFKSLTDAIDTGTPSGRFFFHVMASLAEMERELIGGAIKAEKKGRLRTLKDLAQAAATLASACQMLLDASLPDDELRTKLFEKIPRDTLTQALDGVRALIRPADNVYYKELEAKYRTVRRFLR